MVGFLAGCAAMTARPVFLSYEATLREDFFAVPPGAAPSATAVGVASPDGAETTASCSWAAAAGFGLSAAVVVGSGVAEVVVALEQPVVSTAAIAIADRESRACLLNLSLCMRVPRERGMGVRCRR
ncbi:hypothetical protein GCM10018780_74470 [Streptomyces lanatus]|nr:hypothetical protein GCM10018780_74470 [Streptomyces lanatus]